MNDEEFAPRPSLSKSSVERYLECPRKWANQYMTDSLDRAIQFDIRAEGKLMPWGTLVGQVVDDTVTAMLRQFHEDRTWIENPYAQAKIIVGQYVEFSRAFAKAVKNHQKWPKSEFNRQPLDRYFYDELPERGEQKDILDRVARCLDNFVQSPLRLEIAEYPVSTWMLPAKTQQEARIPWFIFEDIPLYANYDFAIRTPRETLIFEWKTGRPNPQRAKEQLHWYAVYAHEKWNVAYESMRLVPVWLSAGPDSLRIDQLAEPVVAEDVERLTAKWHELYDDLKIRHDRLLGAPNLLDELFPRTQNMNSCVKCLFRSCDGYREAKARLAEY